VAHAAKLVGMTRKALQQRIRQGRLATFEGQIQLADLHKLYPEAKLDISWILERVLHFQQHAIHKFQSDSLASEAVLADEINRLRRELAELHFQLDGYRDLVTSLHQKLEDLQEGCNHKQRLVLQAVIGWMLRQMDNMS